MARPTTTQHQQSTTHRVKIHEISIQNDQVTILLPLISRMGMHVLSYVCGGVRKRSLKRLWRSPQNIMISAPAACSFSFRLRTKIAFHTRINIPQRLQLHQKKSAKTGLVSVLGFHDVSIYFAIDIVGGAVMVHNCQLTMNDEVGFVSCERKTKSTHHWTAQGLQ